MLLPFLRRWLSSFPLLISLLLICFSSDLFAPFVVNDSVKSMSRLLLTRAKSDLTLTIENLMDSLDVFFTLSVVKELKCVSLLFKLK